MTDSPQPYRVLARKYRPRNFDELIGQDAMVQTLANAIKRGRLAHAFLMTGVRGVGKTSTARLIAKALNCIGPDGQGGPTIDPCGVCEPCKAIAEGRHIDVIEMDAASHTGVDDVREIIESVRYAAVSARFKIYIIDEVHMLSKNAFNALLKTLEEPPAHVKFLFATTEVNKVPVTVLSRCQRFDLRRISAEKLAAHFAYVTQAEDVQAEPDALALIAHAAEGSARDGLSILDQAIAHADTSGDAPIVSAAQVRDMLGLSDRGATRRLLGLLLEGRAQDMLAALDEQHQLGVEPLALVRGLLELVHAVTIAKAGRGADDPAQSAEEREALAEWASQIGFAPLHRIWQLLLKGHDEVANAGLPREACEMALLRIVHAASLPDPSELARIIQQGGAPSDIVFAAAPNDSSAAGSTQISGATLPDSFVALIEVLRDNGYHRLATDLHDCARVCRYDPPTMILQRSGSLPREIESDLRVALKKMYRMEWSISFEEGPAEPSLLEQEEAQKIKDRQAIEETPVVRATLAAFPGAELDKEQWSMNG
ncbi:MAG TPA: DNA polymerase III subunit gamma/tau [Sphingobium sp.]